VRLALLPHRPVAWYWAYLVRPDLDGPIVVRDHELALPRGAALEVRGEGLWAELACETPMEHWTLGLEAFAVRLDAPADAYRGEVGERLPVGFDLEWEVAAPLYVDPLAAGSGRHRYQHTGVVHGEILIGRERIEFDGRGAREHAWGPHGWAGERHQSAFQVGADRALHVVRTGDGAAGGYVWNGGVALDPVHTVRYEVHEGPDRLPVAARYVVDDGLEADVEVLALAPALLVAPDGRTARLPRALCRCTLRDTEQTGTGWAEWIQVDAPRA
jgi:hypothetical protein